MSKLALSLDLRVSDGERSLLLRVVVKYTLVPRPKLMLAEDHVHLAGIRLLLEPVLLVDRRQFVPNRRQRLQSFEVVFVFFAVLKHLTFKRHLDQRVRSMRTLL